jgi:hypothetical protein
VRQLLSLIIQGTTLVGFDLENDMKSIGVEHGSVEDISEELPPVHPVAKKRFVKYSLKDVAA